MTTTWNAAGRIRNAAADGNASRWIRNAADGSFIKLFYYFHNSHAKALLDDYNLTFCNKLAVHKYVNRFARNLIKLYNRMPMGYGMPNVSIQPAQFQNFAPGQGEMVSAESIGLIRDVPLEVTVELGRTSKSISDILEFISVESTKSSICNLNETLTNVSSRNGESSPGSLE